MYSLRTTRYSRLFAALALVGALSACTGLPPQTTSGAIPGGVVAEGSSARDQIVCEYDPLYGRDVCFRD